MKSKTFLWRRILAFFVDLTLIYSCSVVLQTIAWYFTYIALYTLFIATLITYYTVFPMIFHGQTPGRFIAGLTLTNKNYHHLTTNALTTREMAFKGTVGIIIPFLLIPMLFPFGSIILAAKTAIIVVAVSLLFLLIFKRQWWDYFSGTTMVRYHPTRKHRNHIFLAITLTIATALITINYPFVIQHQPFQKTYAVKYPATREVKQEARFIKQHSEDPVDYIFHLFETHDIVVLSERIHSEYTQYDFIKKILTDPRFAATVGNIFTECGSISFQDTLNTYLQTSFNSQRLLNSSTAILQRNSNAVWPLWTNTNLFDLLETVNLLNTSLPDSSKISWYFTDLPVDWRTMDHLKFIEAFTTPKRDSLMAVHIIQPFTSRISKQRRHKALVIMNSRHGYGLLPPGLNKNFSAEYQGTTAYLMVRLGDRVANVMINTISLRYGYMMTPIHQGRWDRAFELAGKPDAGFNFAGSPFGEDEFDAGFYRANNVRYRDVFTGFVFYKPLEEHLQKTGFPCEFDNFEDTILRRAAAVDPSSVESFKNQLAFYKQHPGQPVQSGILGYAAIYNLVTIWGLSFLLLCWWVLALLVFLFRARLHAVQSKNQDK